MTLSLSVFWDVKVQSRAADKSSSKPGPDIGLHWPDILLTAKPSQLGITKTE